MSDNDSAALEKAETERDEALRKAEELEARIAELEKSDEPEVEEIDKSELPPAVVARLEKLEKAEADAAAREADAVKKAENAERIAKEERDQRVLREFVAKAETLSHVAGDTAKFGRVLKAASESLSKDDFEALEQRLAATNEQIAKGDLFREMGVVDDRGADSETALMQKAEELRKADPKMSRVDAMREASRSEEGRRYAQEVR